MFCLRFLFLAISVGPIISTSTGPIFTKFAGTTTVDKRSQISFSILQGTLPWQPNFGLALSDFKLGTRDIR